MNRGAILKYSLLPGIWPRLKELFGTGFAHVAYLVAQIYAAVRLLPQNHPYLKPSNIGRFGIRHVLAQASNNLVLERKNIDQIIIYALILIGIILLAGQFLVLLFSLVNQPALAQAAADSGLIINPAFSTLFGTPDFGTHNDVVFKIMDRVFGVPGIFNSCISVENVNCVDMDGNVLPTPASYPFPIHTALHQLFAYYSYGLMIVSVIIILYFVTTIIGETAVSGTPFGQRFNKAWAPIRLIVFFGLIIPVGSQGLNSGQYIVLHLANYSSNFATNGWVYFNDILVKRSNEGVSNMWAPKNLIGRSEIPELGSLVEFMYLVKTCEAALGNTGPNDTKPELDAYVIRSGVTTTPNHRKLSVTDFQQAKDFNTLSDIIFVFGHGDEKKHALRRGHVEPTCGQMRLPISDLKQPGSEAIQANYYNLIRELHADDHIEKSAKCFADKTFRSVTSDCDDYLTTNFMRDRYDYYQTKFASEASADKAIQKQIADGSFAAPKGLKELGWGGAGIWYNHIAELNGAITTALFNLPRVEEFPMIMQKVAKEKSSTVAGTRGPARYDPKIRKNVLSRSLSTTEYDAAASMYHAHLIWQQSDIYTKERESITGNAFVDTVNYIMGTGGLFKILEHTEINPMAQLSSIGKSMMEAAVAGLGVTGGAKLLKIFGVIPDSSANIVTGFVMSVVSVSALMGFMLFYVLPILPFVYFLFAVGAWVKSIFEAMVAVPLWAMAHIRIDGEGLPGRDAANGYYLLLEIMIRPFLIVVGLVGAILTFSALALLLNDIYRLLIVNVYGFDPFISANDHSALEVDYYYDNINLFFFTATYTILIYITGNACFKMIDLVPKSIMRWMGVSVSTFQEDMGDPAATMSGQIYKRANLTISLARQSLSGKPDPGQLAALSV